MATGDSPASARRRLRLALRRARDAAGFTQAEVADKLHWSPSKVQRIESGDVTISVTDLTALLRLLEVEGDVERMTADAQLARKRGWWDEAQYREHLPPGLLQVIQFEQSATVIRVFQYAVFPGLLQDEQYADAILGSWVGETSDETRRIRLEVRMRRKEGVWGRPDPPQYLLILDEMLPQRILGDKAVAVRQLKAVLEFIRQRREVIIRLLPKEHSLYLLLGAFAIYSFSDEGSDALYREHGVTDEIVQNTEEVGRYWQRFEQMWNLCLTPEATVIALEAQYANLRNVLSRDREGSSGGQG
jgi:transcriptional regulator with XRE-family HTH domain